MATGSKKATENVDYTTEQKIMALYELQRIDSKIDEINRLKGELPLEVQDLEDEVAGLETRIKNLAAEVDQIAKDTKARKEDIENAKALAAKYEEQQNHVRNNREFESLSKEVEFQKLEVELCEKRIKEYGAESKAKKKLIEDAKAVLAERKIDLEHKKEELESINEETAKEVEALRKKADEVKVRIDPRLLVAYEKIRGNVRNGLAVVTVKRDACGGCFNRIPPQRQLDIRLSKKIIVCEYCGRILVSDLIEDETQQGQGGGK